MNGTNEAVVEDVTLAYLESLGWTIAGGCGDLLKEINSCIINRIEICPD